MPPCWSAATLDLIDIASPNRFHVEQALAALEHGKHVIVEKPAAVTRGDVQRLIDARARKRRVLL